MRLTPLPWLLLLSLALTADLLAGGATVREAQAEDAAQAFAQRFEQRFRAHANEEDYPAAALAIVQRDRTLTLLAIGHRDARRRESVDTQTVFRLASVSKTFAAGALGLLADQGALAWDDPVVRYAPGFRVDGDASRIRLRHLLEHSSGLMPHAYDNLIEDGLSQAQAVDRLSDLGFLCAPGECYGYQNVVFSLLEPAVAGAAARPYEDWVRERIFEPLAMANASFGYQAFIDNPNHAVPHVRARRRWAPVQVQPHYYRLPSAAGVNASISDVARWLQAQLGSDPAVLSPWLVDYLTTPRQRTWRQLRRAHWREHLDSAHYGMGWRIYGFDSLQVNYHGGWVKGFRADVAFAPELDLGIAILLNAEANSISELSADFWALALEALGPPAQTGP